MTAQAGTKFNSRCPHETAAEAPLGQSATVTPLRPAAPAIALERDAEREANDAPAWSEAVDRSLHASIGRFTGGLSPAALAGAYMDWAVHLAASPGKQLQLAEKAWRKAARLANYAARCASQGGHASCCIEPLPHDQRFAGEAWQRWPYNLIHQAFLLNQQWWHNATTGIGGVTRQHENTVEFFSRQILDMFSPSNFLLTNPEAIKRTADTGGANIVQGFQNFLEDQARAAAGGKPAGAETFKAGRDVAVTPGKVVFRNQFIELIQYAPVTETVRPEPILIVPAWIMKYYILDLSQQNSLVKYLTEQGFTVFMISWNNMGAEDRDLGMEDYRKLGPMAALDTISAILPNRKIHATGYCIGGTLLAVTAAAMARDGDERLQSTTLFAAQTDFTEAGELMLFINESQLDFLEDLTQEQGFLSTSQMAGAFRMLRSNDLVWSYALKNYLMGERAPMNDLMAWNADATRLPARMHSEYLRKLFLDNDLAEGRFLAGGKPVALTDIRMPVFAVGTERDHVAPWRSTHKIHLLTDSDVTYLLTTGGHNAGIVSEPGHAGRSYRVKSRKHGELYADPDSWLALAERKEGSWWPEWAGWLVNHSGAMVAPPPIGAAWAGLAPLCDAPGTYVFQE
jgi:polyhydroxyalkanoate synthase subunit PhaC